MAALAADLPPAVRSQRGEDLPTARSHHESLYTLCTHNKAAALGLLDYLIHVPFVGERALRRRAKARRASAPLLVTDDGPVLGSFAIARWADEHGRPGLFPDAHLDEIERLDALSERLLVLERARMFPRLERNADALLATVPRPLRVLGPVAVASARKGVRYVAHKYRTDQLDASDDALRAGLLELRQALGGRATVFERFSYADVTLAVALQGVRPAPDRWLKVSPATREVWTEPALAEELADLLAWRDRVYEEHRAASA